MSEIHLLDPDYGPLTGNEFLVVDVPQGAGNIYATLSVPLSLVASYITSTSDLADVNAARDAALQYASNAQMSAQQANDDAAAASTSSAQLASMLTSFRGTFLGSYATDADADAAVVTYSVAKSVGLMYENTTSGKFRVWSGTAWADQDASIAAAQSSAQLAATQAAQSRQAAETAAASAGASSNLAQAWATQTGTEVQPGLGFGAKKYAQDAKSYADQAQSYLNQIGQGQVNADWNATTGAAQILNKPVLATVATSGSYADLTNKPAFAASATTDTTNASNITSGTLAGARLPAPTSTSLGGVMSATGLTSQYMIGISTAGMPIFAQPTAGDISGLAPSATIDATNAANISSGTLNTARLPIATASTVGVVRADGTTITINAQGVISSVTGGAGNVNGPSSSVAGHIVTFADTSGKLLADGGALAPSATTDTTNAANITSGVLPNGRIPAPTSGALGGIKSSTAPTNQFATGLDATGMLIYAQPTAAGISGLGGAALLNVGTTAGTVMAGNDSRISGALQATNNLSDLSNKATARTNLGIDGITNVNDANYSMTANDVVVVTSQNFTAPRTWTLPPANTVNGGSRRFVVDRLGTISATNTLTLAASGSDLINGSATLRLTAPYALLELISDGVSKWSYSVVSVERGGTGIRSYTAGQLLIGKANGGLAANTLTAGTGITITNSDGAITIASSAQQSSGTVTSVNVSGGSTGLSFSGGPITSAGQLTMGGVLSPSAGGTGTTSLSSLPAAMGLGTMSTQNASSVNITGGSISVSSFNANSLSCSTMNVSGGLTASGGVTITSGVAFGNSGGTTTLNFAANASLYGTSSYITCGVSSPTWTAYYGLFQLSGGVAAQKDGGGSWDVSSDARMKENVKPYVQGLSELLELDPVTFSYNGEYGSSRDGKRHVGLIAQQVLKTSMRDMVGATDRDGTQVYTVDPSRLVFALINAVRELSRRVHDLEMTI